ncbi:MAG: PadR family transcriptional regulator [Nocardioides sp.]
MARRAETIELAVLGLLHEGPMHGYQLRKRLNLMLGWGRVLSYGTLYPTLKRMLRSALIELARPGRGWSAAGRASSTGSRRPGRASSSG